MRIGLKPFNRYRRQAGFTLAEALAAMMFMAVVIPVAVQALTTANRAAVFAERKLIAVRLGENLLNEWLVTGQWEFAGTQGDYGPGWPGYFYEFQQDTWTDATLETVTLLSYFTVQGQEYSVVLSSLVDPSET